MTRERIPIAYLLLGMVVVSMTIVLLIRLSERVYVHTWVLGALFFLLFALGVIILVLMWRMKRHNKN